MSNPQTDWMVAVFLDRTNMGHERYYEHPIARVWDALIEAEQVGRPWFSLGGSVARAIEASVTILDPPNVIEYTFDDSKNHLRFELTEAQHPLRYRHVDEANGTGTHLWLLHSLAPAAASETPDGASGGAASPTGAGPPWHADLVAGLHEFLDHLGLWLDGRWSDDDNVAYHRTESGHDQRLRWVDFYRTFIRDECPGPAP